MLSQPYKPVARAFQVRKRRCIYTVSKKKKIHEKNKRSKCPRAQTRLHFQDRRSSPSSAHLMYGLKLPRLYPRIRDITSKLRNSRGFTTTTNVNSTATLQDERQDCSLTDVHHLQQAHAWMESYTLPAPDLAAHSYRMKYDVAAAAFPAISCLRESPPPPNPCMKHSIYHLGLQEQKEQHPRARGSLAVLERVACGGGSCTRRGPRSWR